MGTLWLGGAEGLIAQNFTQITGADTGFPEGGDFTSTPPPPWTLSAWRHPPSGKMKNTPLPPPTIAAAQKRTAAAQKTELPKSWGGGLQPPPAPPPASYAYAAGSADSKPFSDDRGHFHIAFMCVRAPAKQLPDKANCGESIGITSIPNLC